MSDDRQTDRDMAAPTAPRAVPVSQRHRTVWPSLKWVWSRPNRCMAFGFGVGLIRPGSGTWGTILAALLWWPLQTIYSSTVLGLFLMACIGLGIWACGQTASALGVDDHVGIVWDEIVAFWLLLWAIPFDVYTLLVAFVLFRFFDVYKPFPIRWFDEHFKGGMGVMIDDLIAALYAWLVMMTWLFFVGPIGSVSIR